MDTIIYERLEKKLYDPDVKKQLTDILKCNPESETLFSITNIQQTQDSNIISADIQATVDNNSYLISLEFNIKEDNFEIISTNDLTEDDIKNNKLSYDISYWSYNITYKQLAEMFEDEVIKIPEMQRGFVWNQVQASKLIESIIMGLPLPSIFLVAIEEDKRKKFLVIDGLQRITTIHSFMFNKRLPNSIKTSGFSLKGVNSRFNNKVYSDLEDMGLIDNFKYNTINVIEFKQSAPYNESAMFSIFERLNSGGTSLSSQQIRNSIFYGNFNTKLNSFSKTYVSKYFSQAANLSLNNSELVLRAIAIYDLLKEENIPEKQFLGSIVYKNLLNETAEQYHIKYKKAERNNQLEEDSDKVNDMFEVIRTGIEIIERNLGDCAFKKYDTETENFTNRISPILFESLLVSYLLNKDKDVVSNNIIDRYKTVFSSNTFDDYFTQGTGKKENIRQRILVMTQVLFDGR